MRTWPRDAVLRALSEAYPVWDARQRLRLIESLTLTQSVDTGTYDTKPDKDAKPSTITTKPYTAEMQRLRDLDVPNSGVYQAEYREYLREVESEREAEENDRQLAEQQRLARLARGE